MPTRNAPHAILVHHGVFENREEPRDESLVLPQLRSSAQGAEQTVVDDVLGEFRLIHSVADVSDEPFAAGV